MLGTRSGSTASRVRRRIRAMRKRAVANGRASGCVWSSWRLRRGSKGAGGRRSTGTARSGRCRQKAGREHWLPLSSRAAGGVGSGPRRSRTARGLPSEHQSTGAAQPAADAGVSGLGDPQHGARAARLVPATGLRRPASTAGAIGPTIPAASSSGDDCRRHTCPSQCMSAARQDRTLFLLSLMTRPLLPARGLAQQVPVSPSGYGDSDGTWLQALAQALAAEFGIPFRAHRGVLGRMPISLAVASSHETVKSG